MTDFSLHIAFPFQQGPWGGGNQFLKALRHKLTTLDMYVDDPRQADAIIFNSHHEIDRIRRLKKINSDAAFIHRLDGPVSLVRGTGTTTDRFIFAANELMADGTILQSRWSASACRTLGLRSSNPSKIITNAPDDRLFFPGQHRTPDSSGVSLIASSWSANARKGHDVYQFLDETLGEHDVKMTFVGNAPRGFKNIRHHPPCATAELARLLREHDLFVTASINDPCSNALLEALHSGLPAVVRASGGHPELVGEAGALFEGTHDVWQAIHGLMGRYEQACDAIRVPSMDAVAHDYVRFAQEVVAAAKGAERVGASLANGVRMQANYLRYAMQWRVHSYAQQAAGIIRSRASWRRERRNPR